jgi:hypothetical protein
MARFPSGGRLVIDEMLYDNDKNGPLEAAVYSVVMLLWQRGRQYSGAELTYKPACWPWRGPGYASGRN